MRRRDLQAGAALLTALIIVTLVASLAAGMVWQQARAVQVEAAERARAQSSWILQGALDWARLILREDAQANRTKPVDHLGEPWAVPLAEARLSTFLAADRTTATDEGPEAFLSGAIEDAQSRYNLRALLGGPQVPALELRVLERLCATAGVAPDTAGVIVSGLRAAFPAAASAASGVVSTTRDSGPLQPAGLDELSWLGLGADTIKRLEPFVVLLPKPTPVNLNTAPREVIAALFDGMDLSSAERLVQSRRTQPLLQIGDAQAFLPQGIELTDTRVSVSSSFFFVTGRLRLDERQLTQRSLVERRDLEMVVLARERVSQLLEH